MSYQLQIPAAVKEALNQHQKCPDAQKECSYSASQEVAYIMVGPGCSVSPRD